MRLSFRKKTLSKILMCSCNAQKFQDEGNEYVKKLLHFHFHCQDCYFFYVYTWKWHPFVAARIPEMDLCANIGLQEICNFCVQIRYLLNFTACKLCLKKIPIDFQEHLVPILKACMTVRYVFYYGGNAKKMNISLHNPEENYMTNIEKLDWYFCRWKKNRF